MKNSRNNYCEELVKDTPQRSEYYDGILQLLRDKKEIADKKRDEYISVQKYKSDSKKYRNDFIRMLGFPLTEKRLMPKEDSRIFVATDGNVNIYRMTFTFFDVVKVYGIYFEQKENKKSPFVMCFHGGEGTPELISGMHLDSANYNNILRRTTDKGANVFAPQLLLWSVKNYGNPMNRDETDGKLKQLGGSITSLELYFARGIIDYFIENEEINPKKVYSMGLSYGGMYSLFLSAIDIRIKACYTCSWVCDCFDYSWEDWCYQNSQYFFTTAEVAALVCPRTLIVAMGKKDELFDYRKTERVCREVERYYAEFRANDKFRLTLFDGGHEFDKSDLDLDFFLKQ